MSFYRTFIAAVAALGLAGAVFADDAAPASTTSTDTTTTTTQDATAPAPEAAAPAAATTTTTDTNQTTTTETPKVNVNTATAKELMAVKGLSSAKAKAIVSYRKKHGDFKSLDDLKMVKGFKKMDEKTMKDVQDQLTTG